jgi:catechol 2,3-dioxygenase-like lactoylglutathione lyase family enzyme
MTLKRVHHIGVAVADMASARALLGDRFGLELVRESDAGNPSTAFYRCGDVEIELLEHSRPEDREAWLAGQPLGRIEHIAIEVDGDLQATLAALAALGVTADPPRRGPFGETARTHPATTTGIVLQLMQPQG